MIGKTAAMTAVILALAMAVAGFALVADSADAEGQMSMTVIGELVDAGGTAEIGIDVSNNPGFEAMEFGVTYNAEVLEYVEGSMTLGSAFTDQDMDTFGATVEDGRVTISLYYNNQGHANMTADGRLVTLQFKVAEGAKAGTTEVGLSTSGPDDMILNMDIDDVPCTLVPGVVDVIGYDIVFTVDGNPVSTSELSFGSVITAPADPVKEPAGGVRYTFDGWEGYTEGMTVTGDMTFAAQFIESEVGMYTVGFIIDPEGSASVICDGAAVTAATAIEGDELRIDGNNIIIGTTTYTVAVADDDAQYTYGAAAVSGVEGPITGDMEVTITVERTVNTYTVTWQYADGNEIYSEEGVAYGQTPEFEGTEPTMGDGSGYVFAGWEPAVGPITGDTVYKAVFAQVFTVTFGVNDGSMGSVSPTELRVVEGTAIVADVAAGTIAFGDDVVTATPADPTVESTYVLSAWQYQGDTVTGDMEVTAVFAPKAQEYTITWLDDDGTTVRVDTLEYGDDIVPPTVSKEPTAQYTYEFAGWEGYEEGMKVTGDASFTAQYNATIRTYTVSFVDGDYVVWTDEMKYGDTIVTPAEIPVREPTAQYTYEFAGWQGYEEGMEVTGDVEFQSIYDRTPVQYTVTVVVQGASVEVPEPFTAGYGTTVTIPSMPYVMGYMMTVYVDGEQTYSGRFTMPAEDVTITVVYTFTGYYDDPDDDVILPPTIVVEEKQQGDDDSVVIVACAVAAIAAVLGGLFIIIDRKR